MHPAASIIVFTTLSGLGYGLAAMLGFGLLDPAAITTKIAHVLALALISAGLLSSTLHLGNPQRAWRAFSQWRSSWLSREGVLAVLGLPVLTFNAAASIFRDAYVPATGILAVLFCIVTVCCTAMIYASLRSVQAWNTRLTPACFLAFSLSGGALLALLFTGVPATWPALATVVMLALAWGLKWSWWNRVDTLTALSTPESATGLGDIGRVRLFERPHMNGNYLTREMGHSVARKHARKLRIIAVLAGGVAPAALVVLSLLVGGWPAVVLTGLACASHLLGVVTERWLFFAEARHAVMNYYGA